MRTNRAIVSHAYLLSASLAMAILGATALVLAPVFAPPGGIDTLIAPNAALGATLTGIGFIACAQAWHRIRRLAGGLLLAVGLAGTLRAAGLSLPLPDQLGYSDASWMTGLAFAVFGLNFFPPPQTALLRRPRQILGTLSGAIGVVLILMHWFFGFRLGATVNPVAGPMLGLYTILSGGGLLVLTRGWEAPTGGSLQSLGTRTVLIGTMGILLTSLLWYVMGVQHFRSMDEQSDRVAHSFETALQQTVQQNTRLIQRLAQRFNLAADAMDRAMAEDDAASYVWDVPGIRAVAIADANGRLIWQVNQNGGDVTAPLLPGMSTADSAPEWTDGARVATRVQFVQPSDSDMSGALISFPVILDDLRPGRLIALVNLKALLQSSLAGQLAPFALNISVAGEPFMTLGRQSVARTRNGAETELLYTRTTQAYGQPLTIDVLHLNARALAFTPNLLFGVAMLGFVLSFFVILTIEQSRLSARGSDTLRRTLKRLTQARQIQEQIGRDAPLSRTLNAIVQLVESHTPNVCASVMLRHTDQPTLYLAAGRSVPTQLRNALARFPIRNGAGACGTAAYLGQTVVTEDIETDERWEQYREFMRGLGLRACWSYPLVDHQGAVAGTLAVYRHTPGTPTSEEASIIEDARNLLTLSLERHEMLRSLERNQQRYGSLFHENPEAVLSLNTDGWVMDVNTAAMSRFRRRDNELINRPFTDLLSASEAGTARHFLALALAGHPQRFETSTTTDDGVTVNFDVTELPIIVSGEVEGVFCIAKDITRRKHYISQLQLLERSVDASINGIVIADAQSPDYPIIFSNSTFTEMTGYTEKETLGQNCRFLQGEHTDPADVERIREGLAQREEVHITLRNYRKDGQPFWNDLYIAPVEDENGECTHFIGVQKDISDQMFQEAELAFHASHDALTGLPNRGLLEDRLLQACEQAKRHEQYVVVLFIDLDGFKPVNDSLGHSVGDRVLIEVSRRLGDRVRAGDTLARFGGDEFVAVLHQITSAEDAIPVIERILEAVGRPYRSDHIELTITASVGATVSDGQLEETMTLIQEADMAMYKAKSLGRNQYQWYTQDINERLGQRVRLRNELQDAIDHNGLELHYQPLIGRSGAVVSFEALLRWEHPEHGFISPAEFIPLAEETGQILPISDWVVRQACTDLVSLRDMGDFRVAVNLSPLQFHRTGFFEALQSTLAWSGLAPDALILELTEGILIHQAADAIELLQAIRSAGIGVAIDDFGTGFSSLSYLKNLPVSSVKIDKSFIRELTTNDHDAAITHSVIDMAHRLHLQVVAEGVETAEQHDHLMAFGCDVLQGYHYARPMPLSELVEFLKDCPSA